MSQQAAITLNTIVYAPAGMTSGRAWWWDRSGGYSSSFSSLSQILKTTGPSSVTTIEHNLNIPIVATADDVCACAGSVLGANYFNGRVGVRSGATAAERLDLYNRIKDLVATDAFKKSITDLDPAYG